MVTYQGKQYANWAEARAAEAAKAAEPVAVAPVVAVEAPPAFELSTSPTASDGPASVPQ